MAREFDVQSADLVELLERGSLGRMPYLKLVPFRLSLIAGQGFVHSRLTTSDTLSCFEAS